MTNIFQMVKDYAARNFFIDVEDKIPIFICSVGGICLTLLTSVLRVTLTQTN